MDLYEETAQLVGKASGKEGMEPFLGLRDERKPCTSCDRKISQRAEQLVVYAECVAELAQKGPS